VNKQLPQPPLAAPRAAEILPLRCLKFQWQKWRSEKAKGRAGVKCVVVDEAEQAGKFQILDLTMFFRMDFCLFW